MKGHNYAGKDNNIICRKCGKVHINPFKGGKHTENVKHVMSESKLNEKNPMWTGDEVTKGSALHSWMQRHKPKPEFCECCNENPPYDLANISGEYKRDVNDFEWLCRGCHMKGDGRMKKLSNFNLGHIPWNKDLTKFDHPSIMEQSKKLEGREGCWKGKKRPEHSKRMKGKNNPMYGKIRKGRRDSNGRFLCM